MPTYEYRCKDCDHEFEIVQAFTDDSLTECPECGGALRKVFGNIGISFKGDGFYKTDSRATPGSSGSSDSSSSDSGGSSDSGSSDSASSGSSDSSSASKATATTD